MTVRRLLAVMLVVHASIAFAATHSDELLEAQVREARAQLAPGKPARVVFAGFAMHSDSMAFRGDVELTEQVMRSIDPQAVVFRMAAGHAGDWPQVSRERMASVLRTVGDLARPQDKVVLLFTTHGLQNLLAVQAEGGPMDAIHPYELQRWLGPLRGKPTLLLISACFSGSFMPMLRGPSRIVLTAASAERQSFGCQPDSRNTFFIEELLGQAEVTKRSVAELVDEARAAIEKREQSMRLRPSEPQAFFGPAVLSWSRQPLSSWLSPPAQ